MALAARMGDDGGDARGEQRGAQRQQRDDEALGREDGHAEQHAEGGAGGRDGDEVGAEGPAAAHHAGASRRDSIGFGEATGPAKGLPAPALPPLNPGQDCQPDRAKILPERQQIARPGDAGASTAQFD